MTVVISLWFLTTRVVIADSRISYLDLPYPPRDLLQKIYPVGSEKLGMRAVIGFSGRLEGAYEVLEYVRKVIQSSTKEPATAKELIDIIVEPLKDKYKTLSYINRKKLSFMIVGVEPNKDASTNRPSWVPFTPEFSGYVFEPDKGKLQERPLGLVNAIGQYDEELIAECLRIVEDNFQLMQQRPEAATYLVRNDLMLHYLLKRSEYVGGLFQHLELGVHGVRSLDYSSPSGVSLRFQGDRYSVYDESGNVEPLISIFDRVQWNRGRFFPQGKILQDQRLQNVAEILLEKQTKEKE
jgi:hypothetical protein